LTEKGDINKRWPKKGFMLFIYSYITVLCHRFKIVSPLAIGVGGKIYPCYWGFVDKIEVNTMLISVLT